TGAGGGPDGEDGLLDGERLPGVGHLQAHTGDGGELGAGGGVAGGHRRYRLSSRRGVQVSMGGSVGRHRGAEPPGRGRGLVPWADRCGLVPWAAAVAPNFSWNPSVLVSNFPVASAPAPAVTPALPPMVRPKNS